MFSHSFEEVGKELSLPMARHESVSEALIRNSEISEVLEKEIGSRFVSDVADVLARKEPQTLCDSIVSSQFDADRLDYMQRDRQMTGVQSSGIDATWLISNLEIGSLEIDTYDEAARTVQTLVLGPKAFHAAENYVLSLFQLYPNVYLHKTTRGAEKLFACLIRRVFTLVREGHEDKVGLPANHPIRRFAARPEKIENAQALDDAVFWGALHIMADAEDPLIRRCAFQLRDRRLPKCIDIRRCLEERDMTNIKLEKRQARLKLACNEIVKEIEKQTSARTADEPQVLIDQTGRQPYKKVQESRSPLNQILIKHGENRFEDMAQLSQVVASAETFEVCRAYHDEDDTEGRGMLENIIRTYRLEREEA